MTNKNEQRKVPELRFPEFSGEWEIYKLSDVLKSKGEGIRRGPFGGALKKDIFKDEGYAIYEQRNAIYDHQNFRYYIDSEKYNEMKSFKVARNDIIMSCSGTIGKLSLISNDYYEGIINQALIRFRTNEKILPIYFLLYMRGQKMQRKLLESNPGSAITNLIPVKELRNLAFPLPSIKEQQKIGEFFSKLDRQIELEEKKLALLEEQKKGYMQKIFSQELRFKDENGEKYPEWEDFYIKDIYSEIKSGNRLPKENIIRGEIPYVIAQTNNNGIYEYIDKNSLDYHQNSMRLFPSGSITISIDNPQAIFLQKEEFFTSNVMRVLSNKNINYKQSFYILYLLKQQIYSYDWSKKFSGPIIMNTEILFPVDKERGIDWNLTEFIGGLLDSLNKQQLYINKKIILLKNRKNTMLNKILI